MRAELEAAFAMEAATRIIIHATPPLCSKLTQNKKGSLSEASFSPGYQTRLPEPKLMLEAIHH